MVTILLLSVTGSDAPPLGLDEEAKAIGDRLQAAKYRNQLHFKQEWAIRARDFGAKIVQHQPTVVHFAGHGQRGVAKATSLGDSRTPRDAREVVHPAHPTHGGGDGAIGSVQVKSASGHAVAIPSKALRRTFRVLRDVIRIRGVVFNACHTGSLAKAISSDVEFAIGAGGPLDDKAAVAFSDGFYQAIGEGHSVQVAFDLGKAAVEAQSLKADVLQLWCGPRIKPARLHLVSTGGGAGIDFESAWFEKQVKTSIENAGPRYTKALNVDLPISRLFDGLGCTMAYRQRITVMLRELREIQQSMIGRRGDGGSPPPTTEWEILNTSLEKLFKGLRIASRPGVQRREWAAIAKIARECQELADQYERTISPGNSRERHNDPLQQNQSHQLHRLSAKLIDLASIAGSDEHLLANTPALVVVGQAGYGKTHLFCDAALRHLRAGHPAILLLGEHFEDGEPWGQILRMLRLTCTPDDFLRSLDAAAEASGERAILLIDALNEGAGRPLWRKHFAGTLETLRQYPHVAIAVSVRTAYEDLVIPDGLIPDRLVRAEHAGFAGLEHRAVESFFSHYGLPRPTVPLLDPELQSPLFLKLLCDGLSSGGTEFPSASAHGVTGIFRFFIDAIDKRLSGPAALDFDPKSNTVSRAADAIAGAMAAAKRTWLHREDARKVVDAVLPGRSWERSLFHHLLAEGLLAEDRRLDVHDKMVHVVRFSYERLADHMIVRHMLDTFVDPSNPESSFKSGHPLGDMASSPSFYQGYLEALSVQVPERLGRELTSLLPDARKVFGLAPAFVESLIWRSPSAFFPATERYVFDRILESPYYEKFLSAVITVAVDPTHPYNGEFLHRLLLKFRMPERDAWWSRFLSGDNDTRRSVDSLIDWARSPEDKRHVSDASVELASIALCWFLTTSHRPRRDGATKGLVALLAPRIEILRRIVARFRDIDDLYVRERIFGIAYGCSMRSADDSSLAGLATDVYQYVFANGTPVAHILLRDYARGVIEVALHRGRKLPIDERLIKPPYGSKWPSTIPAEGELKDRYGAATATADKQDFTGEPYFERYDLYRSVMGGSDFARYVIGTNDGSFEWSSRRLAAGIASTTAMKAEARRSRKRGNRFDLSIAQRWILQRVFELGWTPELFGEVDATIQRFGRHGRGAAKPERIGKKYQWIAYHEFLALVSDNFELASGPSKLARGQGYDGAWQTDARDIDPSCSLRTTLDDRYAEGPECFWAKLPGRDTVSTLISDQKWLSSRADIPRFTPLVGVIDPRDRSRWLVLEANLRWHHPAEGATEFDPKPRTRDVYYLLKSYIVKRKKLDQIVKWARAERWMGRWMPESHPMNHVYLGEFCWAPAFAYQNQPYFSHDGWTSREGMPAEVLVTTDQYLQETGGFDCSIDQTIAMHLPASWLAERMNLRWNGVEGSFFDEQRRPVAYDPSVRQAGPSACLMRRDVFMDFLARNDLEIFWTVLGEKMILGGGLETPRPGRMEISCTLHMRAGRLIAGRPIIDYY